MKKNIILLFALTSVSVASYSQKDTTLSRTVIVENNYNPEVMDASKINVLPRVEELKASKTDIRYITEVSPYSSYSNDVVPFQLSESDVNNPKNGYIRTGYGNYGNVDVWGKYTLNMNPNDRLSFDAGLEGMNGKLKDWNGHNWNSRFYTSHVNADYSHYFKDFMLSASGKFKSQVFNYINHDGFDKQHNTIVDVNASIKTITDKLPLDFFAQIGYKSFTQKYATVGKKHGSQGDFYINGNVSGKLNDDSNVAIAFELDNYSYSLNEYKNFTSFRANPSYNLQGDDWKIRIGAHADYQTEVEKGVEFAPDLLAQYTFSDSYQLYAKVDGGVIINDFNRLNELSPYFIMSKQYVSTSIPFDGKIGFKASPINEMWLHLFAGYRINKNELSYGVSLEPSYTYFYQDKANCMYGGGEFRFGFKDMFDIKAKAVIYNWNTKAVDENFFLATKPDFTLDVNLRYKVIPDLYLDGGYSFVKRIDNKNVVGNYRFIYGNISNLYLSANYEIFNNISVYAKLDNILNQNNFRADCYPTEMFNFIGGLAFRF